MQIRKITICDQEYLQLQTAGEFTIHPLTSAQLASLSDEYFENLFKFTPASPPRKRMSTGKHHTLSPEKLKKKSTKLKKCYVLLPKLK